MKIKKIWRFFFKLENLSKNSKLKIWSPYSTIFIFNETLLQKCMLANCRCIIKNWQFVCRYVYIFRKLKSTQSVTFTNFCKAKSSAYFVKYIFQKIMISPSNFIKKISLILIFSQNSLIPIQIVNGFLGIYTKS
jgi:hypothetical protein